MYPEDLLGKKLFEDLITESREARLRARLSEIEKEIDNDQSMRDWLIARVARAYEEGDSESFDIASELFDERSTITAVLMAERGLIYLELYPQTVSALGAVAIAGALGSMGNEYFLRKEPEVIPLLSLNQDRKPLENFYELGLKFNRVKTGLENFPGFGFPAGGEQILQ